jgi:hypothetical protein
VQEVAGWPVAFCGSEAVAAGLVTPDELRGPRFLRIFPDTRTLGGRDPPRVLRPPDAPAEVTVPHRGQRSHPGLLVHRTHLQPGEITEVKGLRVTSPLRTAYGLARRDDLVERVVAVDRLAEVHRFDPDLLRGYVARYRRSRGQRAGGGHARHADRRSGSPMETRLRMLIVQAGLPKPQVQWVVQDERTRTAVWLDLAWPEHMIGRT